VRLVDAHGSSKPVGGSGVKGCWFPACAGCPALAVCVHETGAVRWVVSPACDDVPGDRLAGGAVPLFPVLRALRLAVGVQEQVSAERAAAVLPAEQVQGAAVQRWPVFAAPFGPVAGLGGVIGGCPAPDQRVPDDLGPGELGHVGACRGRRIPSGLAWICCTGRSSGG